MNDGPALRVTMVSKPIFLASSVQLNNAREPLKFIIDVATGL